MKIISAEKIKDIIDEELLKNDLFLVDINVSKLNKITVFVDSLKGVTIEECVMISRLIEKNLDRDIEDYELEVSSPGLDAPLTLPLQFKKNTGRELEVIKNDGQKIKGTLISAGNNNFEIEYKIKEKSVTGNKKVLTAKKETFDFDNIKSAKVIVKF